MRVEIGEPLQREEAEAKEDLAPVEGCGHHDRSFDPMAEWKARLAGQVRGERVYTDPMPAIEAMPNWRSFVGWVEPVPEALAPAESPVAAVTRVLEPPTPVVDATVPDPIDFNEPDLSVESPRPQAGEETLNLDLGSLMLDQTVVVEPQSSDDSLVSAQTIASPFRSPVEPEATSDATLIVSLGEPDATLDEPPPSTAPIERSTPLTPPRATEPEPDPTLVVSLDESEPTIDALPAAEPEVKSAAPPPASELSAKLAGVRPLAHPGRLPRGFELSDSEKRVLRLCDGRRTTQAIMDEGCALDAAALTVFMKRCAKVKLVTFKR